MGWGQGTPFNLLASIKTWEKNNYICIIIILHFNVSYFRNNVPIEISSNGIFGILLEANSTSETLNIIIRTFSLMYRV